MRRVTNEQHTIGNNEQDESKSRQRDAFFFLCVRHSSNSSIFSATNSSDGYMESLRRLTMFW